MRSAVIYAIATVMLGWSGAAFAASIPTHSRHVEFKITEPCGVLVSTGEVAIEWADCEGALAEVTIGVPGFDDPVRMLFTAGSPALSGLSDNAYNLFFCTKYTKKQPDIYCQDCNPCWWYGYYTEACACGEVVCIRAWMPHCMVLEITNVY